MTDTISLHKSDCALLIGGYQCTCGFHQRQNKTPTALAAEQPKVSVTLNPDAMRTVSSGDAVLAASSVAVTVSSALAAEQPKPEPVAYFDLQKQVFYWARPTMIDVPMTIALGPLPLYTAPPDAEALRRDAELGRWIREETPPIEEIAARVDAMEDKT